MPRVLLGKYQYYKGQFFQVLGICQHTKTKKTMIYHQAIYDDYDNWVRSLKTFFEILEANAIKQPRFKLIKPWPDSEFEI